jgi:amidase
MMATGGATRDPAVTAGSFGAFCAHDQIRIAGAARGPLAGLTFAAKDLFGVAGVAACCGNPTWRATHPPATATATAITALLDAGATLIGLTITDELALSLTGENVHYGTPTNPRCPDRVPGGSSSGSAVAVAAGLCDFALGTDTGGSVRVPASHCGLFGFRPTHGAVPTTGVWPLAPRFDTVGWLARDPIVLARAGDVLLPPHPSADAAPARLRISEQAAALLDPAARPAFAAAAAAVARRLGRTPTPVALETDGWLATYLALQNSEAVALHRPWLTLHRSTMGSLIGGRFARALAVSDDEVTQAEARAAVVSARVRELLGAPRSGEARSPVEGSEDEDHQSWLLWPSAAGAPPLRGLSDGALDELTGRSLSLGALASLAGSPQLSIPAGHVAGLPFGVSLIGPRGADRALLAAAAALAKEEPS